MSGGWLSTNIFENISEEEARQEYVNRLGDNALVLGHRLGEWCSRGPVLEQDIAIINIALDQIGQARNYYKYAATLKGEEFDEDYFAYRRDAYEFRNLLMVEQPNGHWGETLVRQFLFDTFNYFLVNKLRESSDKEIGAIANKAIKEIRYHAQYSAEWVIRLGDGTEESHEKVQNALNDIWMWAGEMFEMNEVDELMIKAGVGVDLSEIKPLWDEKVNEVLELATLKRPEDIWSQTGGKRGVHTEHLGFILAEMQYLPRAYPDAKW